MLISTHSLTRRLTSNGNSRVQESFSFELAVQAMKAGYTSVMIDGSHETFEENVALTKKVVEVANAYGVPVEAELGKVGGKEDDLEAEADHNTDPEEAKEFVERTGVSSLAIAIGTAQDRKSVV